MTSGAKHEDSYSQGLIIGFRMVQVAIGITVSRYGRSVTSPNIGFGLRFPLYLVFTRGVTD